MIVTFTVIGTTVSELQDIQLLTGYAWLPMVTFFDALLLFSCLAGVESVDGTTVLGKLDTKC